MMLLPVMFALMTPQAAPPQGNDADLRCMALLSVAASSAADEQRAGIVSGIMFYYGRIVGRSPSFDVEAGMTRMFKSDPQGKTFGQDGPRCGKELQERGQYLMTMCDHLKAAAAAK